MIIIEAWWSGTKPGTARGPSQATNHCHDRLCSGWRQPEGVGFRNERLHFEAVDYETKLWIDGKFVGEHKGGYDHFQFNIAPFLNKSTTHEISLVVWDPT
ncbi:MAG: sugar-binding domain-containing protein, partial [Chloroflexota bacterium]